MESTNIQEFLNSLTDEQRNAVLSDSTRSERFLF